MSSEKSPHKEIGFNWFHKPKKAPELRGDMSGGKGVDFGHWWSVGKTAWWKRGLEPCKRCGKARFLVESKKCSGKK